MTVCFCHRCRQLISFSAIPGGNPVALADPEHWATSYRQCERCGRLYCGECAQAPVLCPDCPGPRKPPSLEAQVRHLKRMCRRAEEYVGSEMLGEAWGFTGDRRTMKAKVQMLRDHLSASEMQVFVAAARRDMKSSGEGLGYYWKGGFCWTPKVRDLMPTKFIELLAQCGAPDA